MSDTEEMKLRDRCSVLWNTLYECNELLHNYVERMPHNNMGNSFDRTKVDYYNTILWDGLKNMSQDQTEKIKNDRNQYDKDRKNCVWLRPAERGVE